MRKHNNMVKDPFSQSVCYMKTVQMKTPISKKRVFFLSFVKFKGSLALEGSLVLPLFLFFMITVLLGLEMVRFQSNVGEALHQVGNECAFAGYQVKYEDRQELNTDNELKAYMKEQIYPYLCVKGGETGLKVQDLSTVKENGVVHVEVCYQMKPFIEWLPIGTMYFEDEFYGHAWTGFSENELADSHYADQIFVYVTETGSRYHLSEQCTYLRVQVKAIDFNNLSSIRNSSGGKYYSCERCNPGKGGIVFVSAEGNRYHGSSSCSALRRTVYYIPLHEAAGYSPCSKCAG